MTKEWGEKNEFEPRTFGSVRVKRKGLIDQVVNYTSPPTTLNFNVSDVSIYFVHRSLSRSRYIFQYVTRLPSSRRPSNIARAWKISRTIPDLDRYGRVEGSVETRSILLSTSETFEAFFSLIRRISSLSTIPSPLCERLGSNTWDRKPATSMALFTRGLEVLAHPKPPPLSNEST